MKHWVIDERMCPSGQPVLRRACEGSAWQWDLEAWRKERSCIRVYVTRILFQLICGDVPFSSSLMRHREELAGLSGLVVGEGGLLCVSVMCSEPFLEHRDKHVLTAGHRAGYSQGCQAEFCRDCLLEPHGSGRVVEPSLPWMVLPF